MKKYSIITFLLVFGFVATVFAYPHKRGFHHQWWKNEDTVAKLQLSENQLIKINKIDKSYSEQFDSLHIQLREQQKKLSVMLSDPKSNNDQLKSMHDDLMVFKKEFNSLNFEKELKIRDLLSDDQIIKLGEMKKEKLEKYGKYYKQKGECKYGKECKSGCEYKDKKQ